MKPGLEHVLWKLKAQCPEPDNSHMGQTGVATGGMSYNLSRCVEHARFEFGQMLRTPPERSSDTLEKRTRAPSPPSPLPAAPPARSRARGQLPLRAPGVRRLARGGGAPAAVRDSGAQPKNKSTRESLLRSTPTFKGATRRTSAHGVGIRARVAPTTSLHVRVFSATFQVSWTIPEANLRMALSRPLRKDGTQK